MGGVVRGVARAGKYTSIGLSGFEPDARFMVHKPGMFYSGKVFFSGAIAWAYAKEKGLDVTEFLRPGDWMARR